MTSIASNTRYTTNWPALVRELKDAKGWTSKQLADRVGSSGASVGAWLAGTSTPGPVFAAKLAALAEGRRIGRRPSTGKATKGKAGAKSTARPAGGPTRRLRAVPGGSAVGRRTDAVERPDDGVHAAILADKLLPENARAALASVRLVLLEALG